VAALSKQEAQIPKLFASGKNSSEIAKSLEISLQTLRSHLHRINRKLRSHNRLEAVMHAIQRWSSSGKNILASPTVGV
jgi:DNA-binding CsgD family transcriptional regulator